MDAKYFCTTVMADLVALKARAYDIVSAVEQMPDKAKLAPKMASLNALIRDLGSKIDKLNTQCPADWSGMRKDIEQKKQELVKQIDIWDQEHIAGGYVGG